MTAEETMLDAVSNRGIGVRIGFRRGRDRYSHVIYGVRDRHALPIVQSVDDGDYEGWPLSLPVQELREGIDALGNHSLLLMGAAAGSHWSASVTAHRNGEANPALLFDVAVRLHRLPAYLGVAYDTEADGKWVDMFEGVTYAKRDRHAVSICATFADASEDALAKNPLELLRTFHDAEKTTRRSFLPTAALPKQYPATYRWRYVVNSPFR